MAQGRPTLADVASTAGVSVSTASLAFSGAGPIAQETKARVLDAAARLGYSGPNPLGRSLRSGRSGIVAVVIGDQLRRSFRDPVSIQVLDGLVSTLGTMGLGVLLIPASPAPDSSVALDPLLASAPMDVAVLIWGASGDPVLTALQHRGVPVVVGEGNPSPGVPVVGIEDRRGTADLIRYLLGLGHTRFASVTLPFAHPRRARPRDRRAHGGPGLDPHAAPRRGISDAGVEPVAMWECAASLVEEGQAAGRALLDVDSPPTVVVAESRPAGRRGAARGARAGPAGAARRLRRGLRRTRSALARA